MAEYRIVTYSSYNLPASVRVKCIAGIREIINRGGYPAALSSDLPNTAEGDLVRALDRALGTVPVPYREGIMSSIVRDSPFPSFASEATWRRWKQRFLYTFAIDSGLY